MKAFDTDILTEILAGNPAYAERIANVPADDQTVPIVIGLGRSSANPGMSFAPNWSICMRFLRS